MIILQITRAATKYV